MDILLKQKSTYAQLECGSAIDPGQISRENSCTSHRYRLLSPDMWPAILDPSILWHFFFLECKALTVKPDAFCLIGFADKKLVLLRFPNLEMLAHNYQILATKCIKVLYFEQRHQRQRFQMSCTLCIDGYQLVRLLHCVLKMWEINHVV